jgi:hypothetical protein
VNDSATNILQARAPNEVLLRADHFFWLLGTPMQKTVEGLLRSLLYSVLLGLSQSDLSESIASIRHICGPRWQSNTAHGAWSCRELQQMLTNFSSVSSMKTFFLIDALDECEPQDRLDDLANMVLWISRLPNVKLCVSCRPWDVFTRKFEHGAVLCLDELTRRDMEIYVEARLTSAEAEKAWDSDFREQTELAQRFIQSLAFAAEGVFLWTELVVKAICSEIRKGKKVDQLDQIVSDFPTDLDGYFHQLIFNRIGRSQRNIEDTAAALKLAMEIEKSEKTSSCFDPSPEPRSFMNFWLLSQGHLAAGFSWEDYSRVIQPCIERMLSQTASFLHETCKDLLTLDRDPWSLEVSFLHRTVFDFLSDNQLDLPVERRAPKHFSDKDLIFNLSRLRCVCLLHMDYDRPHMIEILHGIINIYQDITHLEVHVSWLLTCESLVVAHVRSRTSVYTSIYLKFDWEALCVKAGMNQIVSELYKVRPCLVLCAERSDPDLPLLGGLLVAMNSAEIRRPDVNLLRQALEHGCDPNSHVAVWPRWRDQPLILNPSEYSLFWCRRTLWQAWLGGVYIRFIQSANRHSGLGSVGEIDERFELRRQEIGATIALLLQYGADPYCMFCVTDHELEIHNGNNCICLPLLKILERITSAYDTGYFQKLLQQCSRETTAYRLRRNQLRRALRSYSLAIDLGRQEDERFLGSLTGGDHQMCSRCSARADVRLTTWCIDCQQQSGICHRCSLLDIPGTTAFEHSCQASARISGISGIDHTIVTFVYKRSWKNYIPSQQRFAQSVAVRYDSAKAIDALKAWYAKDPIEPNLSFEEAIQSQTPSPLHRSREHALQTLSFEQT